MKRVITIFLVGGMFIFNLKTQAQVVITNDNDFNTADQMLLANELFESGEPWAEALGYNLDDLDPFVPNVPDQFSYNTGIESYEYSRYLLNTVTGRSGLGLHMMWSPIIMENAAMQPSSFDGQYTGGTPNGYKEDDMLMFVVGNFGSNANQTPFQNPFPQFADFIGGNDNLPQSVNADFASNFASTRWDRSLMDKTLNLGAMGQSMSKQYLWAKDMLGAYHDDNDDEVVPDGTNTPDFPNSPDFDPNNNIFYGGNNLDGFIGQVLTAESINKTKFLITQLAYDGNSLGMVDPATYDTANGIQYFPTKIAVTETTVLSGLPPKWDTFTVTDPMSKLFDQWSFLLATTSYMDMMDPNNTNADHYAYHEVFDGFPFPASMQETGVPGPYDLMKGTSKVIFLNLMAMHFNATEGTFVDGAMLDGSGIPIQDNVVKALNSGYILVTLEKLLSVFGGTPLETPATTALNAQANYIISHLKDPNGGFYNGFTIGTGADPSTKTLMANAAIIRGLYAAYNATGNTTYLNEANNGFDFLKNTFYNGNEFVFRTEEGNATATYTPKILGVLAGALREANLTGGKTIAKDIYKDVFENVYNKMILREAEATGEIGGDSDGDGISYIVGGTKPFIFATEGTYTILSTPDNTLQNLVIYPNPVNNVLSISSNIIKNNSYSITNMLGQIVQQGFIENKTVNVSNLNSGIYIITIKNNQGTNNLKFIKK